ncbi:MAG: sulfatase-like hydrolase/transferase [Myxococcota bacterium]
MGVGSRLRWLAIVATGCLAGCDPGATSGPEPVERIVLVSIDTLRADRVGCYGSARAETPTLDALAARGVRFENAVAPAAITLPSHATLLTGLDPPQHGVRHNGFFVLSAEHPTLPEELGSAGFTSAAFVSAFVLDARFGLARGFDVYDDDLGLARSDQHGAVPERRGDRTVDAALAWLERAPDRFFVWLHLYDPHAGYAPPSPWAERFSTRLYEGEIAFSDAQLGRFVAAVEERWPRGTLWAVTSDHGESLGEHGENTHSYGVYEATQRVPLILAGPGVPRGRVEPALVALADVAPTLLALSKQPPLANATGRSLTGVLRGADEPPREAAWVETLATQLDLGWSPLLGVRTAHHKYVRAPEPELYDLTQDPRELTNLAAGEPEEVARLDALVDRLGRGQPVVLSYRPGAEERERLEALGYVQTEAEPEADPSLGHVGGIDPKQGAGDLANVRELSWLLTQGRGREALAAYDRIRAPGFPILMLGAEAALQAGDGARAEAEARRALAIVESPGPHNVIGRARLGQGDLDGARRSFERAAALDPEKPTPWLAFGLIAEQQGRIDAAIRQYRRAISVPVTVPEGYWRLAALEIERGQLDEARALLSQVPQAALRAPEAAHRLASAERTAGRLELARTRVDGALRDHDSNADLWRLKGELLDEAGDAEGALAARRRARELEPER